MWKNIGLFALGLGLGGLPVTVALVHHARRSPEPVAVAPSSPAPQASAPAPEAPATSSPAPQAPATSSPDAVPGMPWLKKQPGVTYTAPGRVPDVIYEKYQSFEETFEVSHVDEGSALHSRLGLRPGDKIISVNGRPVGSTASPDGRFSSS